MKKKKNKTITHDIKDGLFFIEDFDKLSKMLKKDKKIMALIIKKGSMMIYDKEE